MTASVNRRDRAVRRRTGSRFCAIGLLALLMTSARAEIAYTAVDIGASVGAHSSNAIAINGEGQIAGWFQTVARGPARAFITGPQGVGFTDLGTLGSASARLFGINDVGQVTGSRTDVSGVSTAFIMGPGGMGLTLLDSSGTNSSGGVAINASGQVAGSIGAAFTSNTSPFLTGPNGASMVLLGNLGVDTAFAKGLNDAGQVVGVYGNLPGGQLRAFITDAGGANQRDLGSLYGLDTHANGINATGRVVGFTGTAVLESPPGGRIVAGHAFVTGANGTGMVDLGTLGGDSSWGGDINDSGVVVGYSTIVGNTNPHAMVFGRNGEGMQDLNSLAQLPSGVTLFDATAINNAGQILAHGTNGQVWLLTPVPEPHEYALLLAGLLLVGTMARSRSTAQ